MSQAVGWLEGCGSAPAQAEASTGKANKVFIIVIIIVVLIMIIVILMMTCMLMVHSFGWVFGKTIIYQFLKALISWIILTLNLSLKTFFFNQMIACNLFITYLPNNSIWMICMNGNNCWIINSHTFAISPFVAPVNQWQIQLQNSKNYSKK